MSIDIDTIPEKKWQEILPDLINQLPYGKVQEMREDYFRSRVENSGESAKDVHDIVEEYYWKEAQELDVGELLERELDDYEFRDGLLQELFSKIDYTGEKV